MFRATVLIATALCLSLTVYGQGNVSQDREKPPTQSSSAGTGGPEGGPTEPHTIYNRSSLRRGDFTFRAAYSDYNREPDDVDIVDVPLSFNVGIDDHLELLFKPNGGRARWFNVSNTENLSTSHPPVTPLLRADEDNLLQIRILVGAHTGRPNFGVNSGFRHTQQGEDPSGDNTTSDPLRSFWEWDPSVTVEQKPLIRFAIELARKHAEGICVEFGYYSLQCRRFSEAVEKLGKEGEKNNVIIAVGPPTTEGAAAETTLECPNKKTECKPSELVIVITISEETVKSEGLFHVIPHEGVHVADALKWWESGCKSSSNPSTHDAESRAYYVYILSVQAYQPHFPHQFFFEGATIPGKNPILPERIVLYDEKMKPEDWQIGINKLLARPKSGKGPYEVTPEFPGPRIFEQRGCRTSN